MQSFKKSMKGEGVAKNAAYYRRFSNERSEMYLFQTAEKGYKTVTFPPTCFSK